LQHLLQALFHSNRRFDAHGSGKSLPGDVSAGKLYWEEDIIDPTVEVSPAGTIPVPAAPGLGYHVRRDLIERWTTEKETWLAH
jgi:hypothetical protein